MKTYWSKNSRDRYQSDEWPYAAPSVVTFKVAEGRYEESKISITIIETTGLSTQHLLHMFFVDDDVAMLYKLDGNHSRRRKAIQHLDEVKPEVENESWSTTFGPDLVEQDIFKDEKELENYSGPIHQRICTYLPHENTLHILKNRCYRFLRRSELWRWTQNS